MNFAKKESQSPTERSLEKHTWAYSPIGGGVKVTIHVILQNRKQQLFRKPAEMSAKFLSKNYGKAVSPLFCLC